MRKTLLTTLILLSLACFVFSQDRQPPVDYSITSDYGPRYHNNHYDWHEGIDYGSPIWTPVEAVEGGDIVVLSYSSGSAGWYIRTNSFLGYWTYMHLFYDDNNPISPDDRYEARSATLEDPVTHGTEQSYIFISWVNRQNNRAEKVLSPYFPDYPNGLLIQARPGDPGYDPDNPYILDENGERILTQGSVGDREIIGPSGNSGGPTMPQHLHLSTCSFNGLVSSLLGYFFL